MYAAAAVQRAARYAAEGGMPYQPPAGYEMQAGYQTVTLCMQRAACQVLSRVVQMQVACML